MGGECIECGYKRSIAALHFDHIDPSLKTYNVGELIGRCRFEKAREEAKKCQILCANCHSEKTWIREEE